MPSARSRRASPSAPLSAVQYIRMSTDHQEYSPVFQRQAIAAYAVAHHIRIVDEYEDACPRRMNFEPPRRSSFEPGWRPA
ncbi:recombinase family protein [Paraburkholderia nemoris]|uniref:recombinase family protein n=1 Tax=Paraburkholderia nemoris TaxID=2793076 RepID=UPI001B8C8A23|nr:recombinase family protein [Paraburkholderia nemoris]